MCTRKEAWTGRQQIAVDNIPNCLASYAIRSILYKTSDLEDKQLRANFSLHLKPRYFWLSRLQRTGGIGTWLSPKGPEPEAKKKNKYILIYSLADFMAISQFLRLFTQDFFSFFFF